MHSTASQQNRCPASWIDGSGCNQHNLSHQSPITCFLFRNGPIINWGLIPWKTVIIIHIIKIIIIIITPLAIIKSPVQNWCISTFFEPPPTCPIKKYWSDGAFVVFRKCWPPRDKSCRRGFRTCRTPGSCADCGWPYWTQWWRQVRRQTRSVFCTNRTRWSAPAWVSGSPFRPNQCPNCSWRSRSRPRTGGFRTRSAGRFFRGKNFKAKKLFIESEMMNSMKLATMKVA